MRTKAGVVILLIILFANSVFAQFPIWNKAESQECSVYFQPDSSNSREKTGTTKYEPFTNERLETDLIFKSSVLDGDYQLRTELDGAVYVNSDITSNTIWTADNTYYVLQLIDVNSAMLVIEPGTTIKFVAGVNAGIRVLNGGTIISRGTPNKPILFTSDASSPWISDYYYAIRIDETASTASVITYNAIEYAYAGIALFNISLDTDIENNYLTSCEWGIIEYGPGHTDIINNLCFGSGYCGIYVNMESLTGVADANSYIIVQNNTCDYQERGMRIYGVDDCNYAGCIRLENNIFSDSNGIGLSAMKCVCMTIANTGFYNNTTDKSCVHIPDYNSVQAISNPYIDGPGDLDYCYLDQGCPFINAGLEYIEETPLIGKTTDLYGMPDSNKIDIGFHHPNWDYSNAGMATLRADFDNSLMVDFNDLSFFTDYWLFDYNEAEQVWWWDWDDSGKIDFGDLAVVAEYWLSPFDFSEFTDFARQWKREVDSRLFDTRPDFNWDDIVDFEDFTVLANEWRTVTEGNPAVSISVDGDANNLSGEVGISVTGCPYSTSEVYIFMDGQLMGKSTYESDSIPGMIINTPSYANGSHSLKAVVCDFNNPFTVSANLAVDFNNPIYYLNIESAYEPNQPFQILGVNAADGNSIVKLSRWWNEEVVWSQQVSGELNIDIPGSVLEGQIYDISIEQEITTASSSSGSQQFESKSSSLPEIDWETIYKKGITAKYNPNELYKFAIFLPDAYYWETLSLFNTADCRRDAVAGIVNRCETMGIKYIILYRDQCTWENFSRVLTGPTSPSVIYAYVVSRGNIALPGEHVNNRTYFKISNGYVVSYLSPSEPLGGGWDGNPEVHSLASLGIGGNQFKLVWIDICYNGYNNDMAQSWMNLSGNPILNKLYVGWFNAVNTSNNSCYGQWSAFFWGYPDPDKGFGVTVDTRYQQAFDQVQNTQEGGLECVGNSILQNSLLGTKGDTSIRFSPNRYDYK